MILLKNEAVVLYLLLPRTVGSAHNRGDLNFRFTLYAEGVRSSNAHASYASNLLLIPYTCDTYMRYTVGFNLSHNHIVHHQN